MPSEPLAIPSPAWCPQCAADYGNASPLCSACGYDAAGELVLYSRAAKRSTKWRQTMLYLLAAVVLGSLVPVTIWMGWGVSVLISLIAAFALVPALVCFGLTVRAWITLTTTRHWAEQMRFGPLGWSWRLGPGAAKWRRWPQAMQLHLYRTPTHVDWLRLADGTRNPQFPRIAATGIAMPRGGPFALTRRVREIHHAATDAMPFPPIDHIGHCPQCNYLLDVPRLLPRPGNCPECGWRFGDDTLLLEGFAGPTFKLARPPLQHRASYALAAIPRRLASSAFAIVIFGVMILPRLLPSIVPYSIHPRMIPYLFVLTSLGISLGRRILRRVRAASADDAGPAVVERRGDHFLWLSRDGFAQRPVRAPMLEDGELIQHAWTDFTWRVLHLDATIRLIGDPKGASRYRRWRLRRSLRRFGTPVRLRRLDFVMLGDREMADRLRQHLRGWASAIEANIKGQRRR